MSDFVWVSDLMGDSELILPLTSDLSQRDKAALAEGEKSLRNGKPVPEELCPKRIWDIADPRNDETPVTSVPDLFDADGRYIVSERAADILRQFDLGEGALYPVSEGVFQKDNVTRIPGNYFSLVFGNVKSAVDGNQSRNLKEFAPGYDGWWCMPFVLKDDDVAVSNATSSPPDIWVDPTLFKSVFFSASLGQALSDAGLAKSFSLKRARVI